MVVAHHKSFAIGQEATEAELNAKFFNALGLPEKRAPLGGGERHGRRLVVGFGHNVFDGSELNRLS
jgi:hypothetical protein